MITVATSIPDDLAPQVGDRLHFEAEVQSDGSLLVINAIKQSQNTPGTAPRMSLAEWVKKYAGTLTLDQGETRESLRNAYLAEKFGS